MASLARAAVMANRSYLQSGMQYIDIRNATGADLRDPAVAQAELNWRLARKNVHVAFSNFASAFYRMMLEPASRQKHVAEFNNLLIQSHMLASQIAAVMTTLLSMPKFWKSLKTQTHSAIKSKSLPQTNTSSDKSTISIVRFY